MSINDDDDGKLRDARISGDSEDCDDNDDYDDEMDRDARDKKKTFLDSLKKSADEIKDRSLKIGKTTAKNAEELGSKIDNAIDDGLSAAKGIGTSKNEILDLLERLARMKEQGILTEKEFAQKKKDLLEKI